MTRRKPAYPPKTVDAFMAYAARRPDAVIPDFWRSQADAEALAQTMARHPAGRQRPAPPLTAADGTLEAPLPAGEDEDR